MVAELMLAGCMFAMAAAAGWFLAFRLLGTYHPAAEVNEFGERATSARNLRSALRLLILLLISGCEDRPRYDMDCDNSFDEDPSYQPTQGVFELDYMGWAGQAPKSVRMHVRTTSAETLFMQGCGYQGDDFWWVDAAVDVPSTVIPPADFGNDLEHPTAIVRMWTFDVYDVDDERKTSLATAEGTVHQYDTAAGILRADYRLSDTRSETLETATISVHADLTWEPE